MGRQKRDGQTRRTLSYIVQGRARAAGEKIFRDGVWLGLGAVTWDTGHVVESGRGHAKAA